MHQKLRRSGRTRIFASRFSPHLNTPKSYCKRSISLNFNNQNIITKTTTAPVREQNNIEENIEEDYKEEKIEERINNTTQDKKQTQLTKEREANHGRISVAIRRYSPPFTSIIQRSQIFRIAGLNWRLQILFTRNSFTGQSRFLSVYVICENLPYNENLIALINFRIVSQEEGYEGFDKQIIAHFNQFNRSVGVSSFLRFSQIFAENSEYVNKDFNEAQIVAIIQVKSRQKVMMSINQRIKYLAELHDTLIQYSDDFELNKNDKNISLKRRNKLFNLEINDKIERSDDQDLIKQINRESTLEFIENTNPDEHQQNNFYSSINNSDSDKELEDINCSNNNKTTKITDFFPSRRSSRIKPSFLDILRLQILKEQVNLAVNEPYLEIFLTKIKGRGLRTTINFAKDEFVVEYKGEIINMKRASRREIVYSLNPKIGCYMFYFTHNNTKLCIDATKETGDKGRLVNHSRLVPNMRAKVIDFGEKYPHLCLVALREIHSGEELLFDYGDRTALTVEKHPWLLNT